MPRGDANRQGRTDLIGLDEWRATDHADLRVESWHIGLFSIGCEEDTTYQLGNGDRSARQGAVSGSDWNYSGVPSFYDLSEKALAYSPNNSDTSKRDPTLKFAIRLTRAKTQANTSAGRSIIKPGGSLEIYAGAEAKNIMAAVSTSEVYFERPTARDDGQTELASLFNPYWQVHLIQNSAADVAAAIALQAE